MILFSRINSWMSKLYSFILKGKDKYLILKGESEKNFGHFLVRMDSVREQASSKNKYRGCNSIIWLIFNLQRLNGQGLPKHVHTVCTDTMIICCMGPTGAARSVEGAEAI
jgi:hypothetical protein